MRVAAIEVSHWHSLWDAAYLRILAAMPDVQLVGLHDPDAAVVARRAAEVGKPPVFTDYRAMLARRNPTSWSPSASTTAWRRPRTIYSIRAWPS